MHSPLPWELLSKVARSFTLTLRLLPVEIRDSVALAYLLARLSDTEADGASSDAEEELLDRRSELESLLGSSRDQDLIREVWSIIREGQAFDTRRFASGEQVLSPAELDEYTYLVAGCVGKFWTEICLRHLPGFSRRPATELIPLGIEFGKALQVVNILRDRKKDLRMGRVYVPEERFASTLHDTRRRLDAARAYIESLARGRLRIATALPYLIARETLDAIEQDPEHGNAKIPRSRVYALLLRASFF